MGVGFGFEAMAVVMELYFRLWVVVVVIPEFFEFFARNGEKGDRIPLYNLRE